MSDLRRVGNCLLLALALAACRSDQVEEQAAGSPEPTSFVASSGNGHEGEIFGDIYSNAVKQPVAGSIYKIRLTPIGGTVAAVAALGDRWDPIFVIGLNLSNGLRAWEWFDQGDPGGECTPGSTLPELHYEGGRTSYERHCIVPGRYTLELLDTSDDVLRTVLIDYMGTKRWHAYLLRASIPFTIDPASRGLANQDFVTGFFGVVGGSLLANYGTGDLPYDLDVAPPSGITEAAPAFVIENVGSTPDDTLYVPLTGTTVGAGDVIRINVSGTPGSSPYTQTQRLARIWLNDAAGSRPITGFYWASSLWEHLRSFPISTTSGCPQFGVETLLPSEVPATLAGSQVVWRSLAVPGRCASASLPDLFPSIGTVPSTWNTGAQASVQLSITNGGTAASTASANWRVFLSGDGSLDREDHLVGSGSAPVLGSGGSQSIPLTFNVPFDTATTFRLIIQADADRGVEEGYEGNNVLIGSALPVATRPDLVISPYTPPGLALGTSVTMTYTAQNVGGQSATAPWTDRFYLSPDASLNKVSDTLFGSRHVTQSLDGGQSIPRSVAFSALPTLDVGVRHLIASTDDDAQILEGSESNNLTTEVTINITYASGTDLAVTTFVGTQSGGGFTNFRFSARNIGQSSVSCGLLFGLRYSYYLSIDSLISANDYRAPTVPPTPCPSTSGTTFTTTTAPNVANFRNQFLISAPPGMYFMLAKIDSGDYIVESNEGNNIAILPTKVVVQ